jgi:dTDP-4-dehydrorhamnose reductase
MLGRDMVEALDGRDVVSADRSRLDITDLDRVRAEMTGVDVIINTAAYTNVDEAETHEPAAFAVNATGAHNLATAAAENGARLVQLSTDYVFDGRATSPYHESAELNPISAYGRTKAVGERVSLAANPDRTLIVRTAWLYGAGGSNFASTMLRLAQTNETVRVVEDQRGQPTWTRDLARQIVALLDSDASSGVFHATSSGDTTWFGFARAVFGIAGLDPERVLPTSSDQFVRPAPRPTYSVLRHSAWETVGLEPMRDWTVALAEAWGAGALVP